MFIDLRTAWRHLRRSPGYAAVVIATLGLGIGGVTAVFTLADPMIFRPLPYAEANRVVEVRARVPESASLRLHADDFVIIAEQSRTLDAVSTLSGPWVGRFAGRSDAVLGGGVSRDFLRLTGLQPALGRLFAPEEYGRGRSETPSVAVLTWDFWHQAFGGATDVIGSRLELPPTLSMEIVGVLPAEFFYPQAVNEAPAFIVPADLDRRYLGRANVYPTILARVRPEFTFAQAEAEIDTLLATVERAQPDFEQNRRARLIPLQELLFRSIRTPLLLLFIATGCLLALAWVNLAHFALARAQARARDLAVRVALGASRLRLVRLLLAEAGILAALGAGVGLLAGQLLFTWGFARTPRFSHIYRLLPAELDGRVVTFAILLAVLAMVALGIAPALRAGRSDLRSVLASLPGGRRGWRAGGERVAIVGQTAFAVGLVVICLLVVRSFVGLLNAERGFDPAGVVLASVEMPDGESPPATAAQHRRLLEALNGLRGVEAAAVGNGVPALTLTEPLVLPNGENVPNVVAYQVSGRFADAMDMRLEQGRLFTDEEAFEAAPVAVVDRTTADSMWPGEQALGRTVRVTSGRTLVVVGVLQRVRTSFYEDRAPSGIAFVTMDTTSARVVDRLYPILRLDSRAPASQAELAAAAQRAVPGIVWGRTGGMSSWERLLGQPRFLASALGVLAVLTILLAGFGILGVISHLVSRRTREIGIRMALGADRRRVRLLVVRQALLPAAAGVAGGLMLAFWWSASVRSAIVGIGEHDPWSFAGAAAAVLLTVFLASAWPAARASRTDPAMTLRAE